MTVKKSEKERFEQASEVAKRVDVPDGIRRLVRVLDEAIRIPGTNLTFGLDAILGFLLPGAGDAVTAIASVSLLFTAVRRGVPSVVLSRMVMNILIDLVGGSVPGVGDAFDFLFRSNKMNLELLEKYEYEEREPGIREYAIVGLGLVLVAASVILPIVLAIYVGGALWQMITGR